MRKKIIFFSGSRAEYYIQLPILKKFQASQKFKTFFVTSGSHTSKSFGETINLIKKDKIKVFKKIEINITSNKPAGLNDYNIKLQKEILKIFDKIKPDLIFLTSDRFETFSVGLSSHLFKIPIIHLEGGDITEGGTLDDNTRHALTKLSMLHLVTNEDSLRRVQKLGEEKKRIINVGFPPLTNIDKSNLFNKNEIMKKLNFEFKDELNIFTYHPVPGEENYIKNVFNCVSYLANNGHKFIITYPNFDPGYKNVIKEINKIKSNKNVCVEKNLGQSLYFSILKFIGTNNGICVGNSSSGIKETMFFNCKTINLGARQNSRYKTKNIYDCNIKNDQMLKIFNHLIKKRINYKKCDNPYYSPKKMNNIVSKIYKKINNLNLKIKKITY